MSSPVLKLPSYKIFLNQITNAKKNIGFANLHEWNIKFYCKFIFKESLNLYIPTSNIWIQCKIISVNDDSLIVDDDTGHGWVTGISNLPQFSKRYLVGDYVMVLGYILSSGPFSIANTNHSFSENICLSAKIKAIKVTVISSNESCRNGKFWKKEVIDAQSFVLANKFNL